MLCSEAKALYGVYTCTVRWSMALPDSTIIFLSVEVSFACGVPPEWEGGEIHLNISII